MSVTRGVEINRQLLNEIVSVISLRSARAVSCLVRNSIFLVTITFSCLSYLGTMSSGDAAVDEGTLGF